jgi:GNAT superfamily N-acetyltransferase
MPELVLLTDRSTIEAFLRRDTARHLFELGDLDERYWPHTKWYRWQAGDRLSQIALLYTRPSRPVLLFYGDPPLEEARDFATALLPHLPTRMYAHLGLEVVSEFERRFGVERRGLCQQMQLIHPERLPIAGDDVAVLTPEDAQELAGFYERHYPDTAFDPGMLSTRQFRAVRREGTIVSVAGLHIYSDAYHVAALGNVATAASVRRLGLGRRVSAALCRSLVDSGIETIGLDVMVDNSPAIAMWESLGFETGLVFQTCTLEAR